MAGIKRKALEYEKKPSGNKGKRNSSMSKNNGAPRRENPRNTVINGCNYEARLESLLGRKFTGPDDLIRESEKVRLSHKEHSEVHKKLQTMQKNNNGIPAMCVLLDNVVNELRDDSQLNGGPHP